MHTPHGNAVPTWELTLFACSQPSVSDAEDLEEMERLRKEHIEALREIKKLQVKEGTRRSPATSCSAVYFHIIILALSINLSNT